MSETPATIITRLGGPTVVANFLTEHARPRHHVDNKTVSNWKMRGIPLRYWRLLLGMASMLHVHNVLNPMEFIDAHTDFRPRLRKRTKTR